LAAAAWKAKPALQSTAGRRALPLAPRHIAIAPGGHRLWAADRLLPEVAALIQGLECLMETVAFCSEQRLTFLALPSDHALEPYERSVGSGVYWRPALMRAVWAALNKLPPLEVRLRLVGEWTALDRSLIAALLETQARTRSNAGLWLDLRPVQPLSLWERAQPAAMAQDSKIKEASTAGANNGEHEPHLVIRTGGSTLSNDGMVWDTTRSALYFTNRAWPDFTKLDLRRALHWYGSARRASGIQAGRPARNHKRLPTNDDRA
jgi:undecaprenyl diphosphate synthase